MLLSVLMPCLESRPWRAMQCQVDEQIIKLGMQSDVEFLMDKDAGEVQSGLKRQRLLRQAKGEYVCFVDDDDRLSPNWLERFAEGMSMKPDVVSFNAECRFDGRKPEIWAFRLQQNDRPRGVMGVNHLCPIRREIALKIGWCPELGYGDDQIWVQPLIASGLLKVEYYCDETLYYYIFNSRTTANQTTNRQRFARSYVGKGLRCFKSVNDEIMIEIPHRRTSAGYVWVRDSENQECCVALSNLRLFHISRIV